MYVSRLCACAKRTGAAARESLRRDHPGDSMLEAAPVLFAHAAAKAAEFFFTNTKRHQPDSPEGFSTALGSGK